LLHARKYTNPEIEIECEIECEIDFEIECEIDFEIECEIDFEIECEIDFEIECEIDFEIDFEIECEIEIDFDFEIECGECPDSISPRALARRSLTALSFPMRSSPDFAVALFLASAQFLHRKDT
jgi:hypothetical protein